MFCSRCGTWAPDDATLCTLCGAALQDDNLPRPERSDQTHGIAAVTPLVQYGGFWRRFAAAVLDSAVLWFPSATLRVLMGLDPFAMIDAQSPSAWVGAGCEFVLGWLYAALMIRSSARGTLGLQVMDLQVTDLHGDRVSFARASWRYLAQILTFFTFGIGYLLQLATPRRQTLHDLVSATVVVRARPQPAPARAQVLRMAP